MEILIAIVIILIFVIVLIYVIAKHKNKSKQESLSENNLPYVIVKKLLTDKELRFYNCIKPIADEYDYSVMCKVRLADLTEIPNGTENYIKWFNATKSKHIDFVICKSDTSPIFAIEVDDHTHDSNDRKKRDEFINKIFEDSPVKLLRYRTWTIEQLKKDLTKIN